MSPRVGAAPSGPVGFPADAIAVLPRRPGVYRFSAAGGTVLYIGRATELRSRVRSYWGDLGDRGHLAPMVRRIARIEAVVCASVHEAAWLERNLIAADKPRWNRGIGGAEVEVYIRLRDGGPEVVHQPDPPGAGGRCFGPYLGGVRTRSAVAGLHRLFPLRYASAAGGAERGMAEVLGIAAGDRDALIAELTAVLERRPRAVRRALRALAERRDQLAAIQSYEAAGAVQAEAEAVDWITAEQKVCLAGPIDQDLCGWADGHAVRFAMRAGRIVSWTTQRAPADRVRRDVAATPTRWRDFVDQNARLAAALSDRTATDRQPARQSPRQSVQQSVQQSVRPPVHRSIGGCATRGPAQ